MTIDTAMMRDALEILEQDLNKLRASADRLRAECVREIERTNFGQDCPVDAAHDLQLVSAKLHDAIFRAASARRSLSDYDDVLANEESP